MRGSFNVTTAAQTINSGGQKWSRGIIQNLSDADVYVQFTTESDALTTGNGLKVAATSGVLEFEAPVKGNGGAVQVIHGGSGNKAIRYVLG
jgi:hypothetical protein